MSLVGLFFKEYTLPAILGTVVLGFVPYIFSQPILIGIVLFLIYFFAESVITRVQRDKGWQAYNYIHFFIGIILGTILIYSFYLLAHGAGALTSPLSFIIAAIAITFTEFISFTIAVGLLRIR